MTGHDPNQEPDWFAPFCPIKNVTADYPPTLLISGDQDTAVPIEQSVSMSESLGQQGVEHELIALWNLGHGFDGAGTDDSAVADVLDRVIAFLDKHIAP